MTATDELRRMLDERGVEWREHVWGGKHSVTTFWRARGVRWHYRENRFGELRLHADGLPPAQAIEATLGTRITGETSDGYHTFNELYHHRAVLFSVIVRDHQELAWKSKLHHDGTMYDGMFIVGIETPTGQATYHYDIAPYWEMFDCKELEQAPEWDGHTPADAIARIATLGRGTCRDVRSADHTIAFECSECGCWVAYDEYWETGIYVLHETGQEHIHPRYCPNCGRRIEQ